MILRSKMASHGDNIKLQNSQVCMKYPERYMVRGKTIAKANGSI
jgi:hypothetical protein